MKLTQPISGAALGLCLVLLAGGARAEDPKPTPTRAPQTLGEMAKGVKLQGKKSVKDGEKKSIVISDQNLSEYAEKGRLTTAKPGTPALLSSAAQGSGAPGEKDKEYWRKLYTDQLGAIEELEKEIAELDLQIPKLWNDFYARDDPAYRDGVIKPKLDNALVKRQKLEEALAQEKGKPAKIKNDARKAGAEPGWFRGL